MTLLEFADKHEIIFLAALLAILLFGGFVIPEIVRLLTLGREGVLKSEEADRRFYEGELPEDES